MMFSHSVHLNCQPVHQIFKADGLAGISTTVWVTQYDPQITDNCSGWSPFRIPDISAR
jgi:hypothetical protein